MSSLTAVQEVKEDIAKVEQNSSVDVTSVFSCVSSLTAVQDVNKDIPKAEQNRDTDKTSMYIWHNFASSFTAVQDVDKDIQQQYFSDCLWFMTEENNSTASSSDIFFGRLRRKLSI